jgi:hypothetical protein
MVLAMHECGAVTNTWSTPKVQGDAPSAREGHSAALIGTNIYIFGGCGKSSDDSEESYYNDLYILDTSKPSLSLQEMVVSYRQLKGFWKKIGGAGGGGLTLVIEKSVLIQEFCESTMHFHRWDIML